MDQLAAALGPTELYDYREGDTESGRPPVYFPHFQADVFEGVELPGVAQDEERLAMLFMHPCTMREGTKIRAVVTAVEVRKHPDGSVVKRPERWDSWYKGMPLPDLRCNGTPYSANFMSLASGSSASFDRSKRIAILSVAGRVRFQQRIIYHLTRYAPDITSLEGSTRNVEFELELQTEWLTGAFEGTVPSEDEVVTSEGEFGAYLEEPPSFQELNDGVPVPSGATRRDILNKGGKSQLFAELASR